MASQLYGIRATDPTTYAAGALTLFAVVLAAVYIPARLDPVVALSGDARG
jgi:hypothetical protein